MIGSRKVIDCFMFNNELEMLNLRLHEMADVVDHFVLCESTRTHAGNAKPLGYNENKSSFKKFSDKIVHVIVDDAPLIGDDSDKASWTRERHQRSQIALGLDQLEINDQDLIILSDVDEIVRFEPLIEFVNSEKYNDNTKFGIEMSTFFYDFYHERRDPWYAAVFFSYAFYKSRKIKLTEFRQGTYLLSCKDWRKEKYCVRNGGWHLSWFGGEEFIKEKMNSFAHHGEFKGVTDKDIREAKEGSFFLRRKNKKQECIVHKYLPEGLPKYKHLILNK